MKVPRFWFKSASWQAFCLQPISMLYRLVMTIRKQAFLRGFFNIYRSTVPVIVVGNLTVGGTGKTPLVIAIIHKLKEQGWKPGIVSRGYGGKSTRYPCSVTSLSDPHEVGDEPVCMAEETRVPVIVDPNRARAVQYAVEHFACNVIVSDDGLQHYGSHREVEVVVVDGVRRFGNAYCLPAGPLREPVSRLKTADFIVNNGGTHDNEVSMKLIPGPLVNLIEPSKTLPLAGLRGQKFHAIAGIGHPERFFNSLASLGVQVLPHPLADHAKLTPEHLIFPDQLPVRMTHKDAIKCRHFAGPNCWYLPVTAVCDESFYLSLMAKIR